MFYGNNPDTRAVKYFTAEVWVSTSIKNLLRFTLSFWNDRYDALHGATNKQSKRTWKTKMVKKLERCYSNKEMAMNGY